MAEATVYVSDREVGVRWDDRGPVYVLDRDGVVSMRFTVPLDSEALSGDSVDEEVWKAREQGRVEGERTANEDLRTQVADVVASLRSVADDLDGAVR